MMDRQVRKIMLQRSTFKIKILYLFCFDLTQIEYLSRLDYLWKCHLKQKKEESSTTHMVNTILFRNIVPLHVAEFFLNGSNENKVSTSVNELALHCWLSFIFYD